MKTLFNSLLMITIACVALSQPAYADNDRWRHGYNKHNGHGYGHHKPKHWRHNHHPHIVYQPARVYYYAPPRVVYYQQPVYAQPGFSFNWLSY